jgi:serine/threonine protein kinase
MSKLVQLLPGTLVAGDFRVVEPLSSGGMGAVYVAEQRSTGKRRALKVMHPQLVAEPKLRERFVQEARVGALIKSDHVVQVIAAGVESELGDMPWIAMELLEGQDLADYVAARGHLTAREALGVLRQVAHALAAAHAAGVVHRDIKPENVFVARSQSAHVPTSIKVLDFGIAKVVAQAKTTATALVGSPAWMAPEQTDPAVPITPATDVWAVGLLTFWMLTGRSYWTRAHDPGSSMLALMREILFGDAVPASERARAYEVAERLPSGFDAWFARCIERDPELRYPEASAMLSALEQVLDVAAVEASIPPPSVPYSLARGPTRSLADELASGSIEPPASSVDQATGGWLEERGLATLLGGENTADTSRDVDAPAAPREPRAKEPATEALRQVPFGGTAPGVESEPAPRAERAPRTASRKNLYLTAALGAVALGAAAFFWRTRNDTSATPTDAPAPTSLASVPSASQIPAPRDEPSAAPSASAPPSASASAPAAAPARPPFNEAHAQARLRGAVFGAENGCATFLGPAVAFGITVTWDPVTGNVSNVAVSGPPGHEVQSRRFCVQSHFRSVHVTPYAGAARSSTVSVSLPERQ